MFRLAMVAPPAAAIKFDPTVGAQNIPTASGVQGHAQSVGNNSTQEK